MKLRVEATVAYQQAEVEWAVTPQVRLEADSGRMCIYGMAKKQDGEMRGQEYAMEVDCGTREALAEKLESLASEVRCLGKLRRWVRRLL